MQARSRRSVAGKDIMLDPRAGIRKAGAMPPLMALLKEVVEVSHALQTTCCTERLLLQQGCVPNFLHHALLGPYTCSDHWKSMATRRCEVWSGLTGLCAGCRTRRMRSTTRL